MTIRMAALFLTLATAVMPTFAADAAKPPRTGPVQIMKASELKPGMMATAWTVFTGTEPEAVPVEIIGLWKNAWGPKQDIIDGKLIGAVALRMSVFSPDAICGITPIELMLEINDLDQSRPSDARTPENAASRTQVAVPGELLAQAVAAGASPNLIRQTPL